MARLLGLVVLVCVGCGAQPRHVARVEAPDPVVGDLRCAAPRISLIDALRRDMTPANVPAQCEAREEL